MSLVTATGSMAEILTHQGHQHELAVVTTGARATDTGHYSLPGVKPGVQKEINNPESMHHHEHHDHQLAAVDPESALPGSETDAQQNECVCDDICCAISAMSPIEPPLLAEAVNADQILNKVAVYNSIFLDLLIPPPETLSV